MFQFDFRPLGEAIKEGEKLMSKAHEREPEPKKGKENVLPNVIKDLKLREEVGIKRYGTPLQTHNGRNSLMDAYQEALDLAMYLKQKLMEEENNK